MQNGGCQEMCSLHVLVAIKHPQARSVLHDMCINIHNIAGPPCKEVHARTVACGDDEGVDVDAHEIVAAHHSEDIPICIMLWLL